MASKNKEQTEKNKTERVNFFVAKGKQFWAWAGPTLSAIFWLVETVGRAFVSYMLLNNSHEYIVVLTGLYFAVTAAMLVVKHFFTAHR